jgi:hypothetical protein
LNSVLATSSSRPPPSISAQVRVDVVEKLSTMS